MVLKSSVLVDELLFDHVTRPHLHPRSETLHPTMEYEIVARIVIPNSPETPIPCCIVNAHGHLYLAVKKALENATNIAGKQF